MVRRRVNRKQGFVAWVTLIALLALPLSIVAQTQIKYHSNKYSVQDDIKLGQEAARQAEQQFPILRDEDARRYVERVGQRLVGAIPSQYQHHEFRYYFKIVNANDINAFALPGGPMYVNRGMIEAARNEGEMAGVMAHEISHVALRHGTAQATKAQKYSILSGIAGIAGTIFGGPGLGQLAQAPFAVYILKFSREYETEADILGAQIMARAGYDPRDLANMFQTIERQSGGGGGGFLSDHPSPSDRYARINREAQYLRVDNPVRDSREFARIQERFRGSPRDLANMFQTIERQSGGGGGGFLSDHPSPSDRYARINREAQYLRVDNPVRDSREFARIQERFRGSPRAQSMAEISRSGQRYPTETTGNYPANAPGGRVEYPSTRFQNYSILNGDVQVSVPNNWRQIGDSNSVWFAPEGAYGQYNGQAIFTHGVNFGVAQTNNRNLQQATNEFVNNLAQQNNGLRSNSGYQRTTLSGRTALWTALSNTNEATGSTENVRLITTQLSNGQLFYMIAVAPSNDRNFEDAFRGVANSIRINY